MKWCFLQRMLFFHRTRMIHNQIIALIRIYYFSWRILTKLTGQPARTSVMLDRPSCCTDNTNCLLKKPTNNEKGNRWRKDFSLKTSGWNPFQAYLLELRIIYSSCNTKYDKENILPCFSIHTKRKCWSLNCNKSTKNILSTAAATAKYVYR